MSPAALVNPHSCFVVLADTGQAMQKVRRREREPLREHVHRVKHMVDHASLQPMIEGARVVGFDSCLCVFSGGGSEDSSLTLLFILPGDSPRCVREPHIDAPGRGGRTANDSQSAGQIVSEHVVPGLRLAIERLCLLIAVWQFHQDSKWSLPSSRHRHVELTKKNGDVRR